MYTTTHLPFWLQVLERCKHSIPGSKTVFVCPTDASIDCVQSHLSETMSHGYPVPAFYTLRQLMLDACPLKVAPVLLLLEKLHAVSSTLLERHTTFEHFYAWGKALLQDFDLMDRYLIQPEDLFATLVDYKKLNTSVEEKKTVYTHSTSIKESDTQQALFPESETIVFWETLPLLYQMFTRNLIEEGLGYEGLCIRITATETIPKRLIDCQELVFVGFNLLTPAEVQFMEQCAMCVATSFFWDTDAHYLDNLLHPAGHYLRKHRMHPCFQAGFSSNTPTYLGDERKKVFVSETNTTLAQVQHVLDALQTKTNGAGIPHSQTALVVSGTDLLLPLLEKLSGLQIPLRARLQYPLKHTVMYAIAEKVIQFWEETHMPVQNIQRGGSTLHAICCLMNPLIKADVQIGTNHCSQQHVQPNTLHVTESSSQLDIWNHALQQGVVSCLQLILSWLQDHFTPMHTLLLDLNRSALQHLLAFLAPWTKKMNRADCAPSFLRTMLREQLFPFHACSTEPSLYLIDVSESHNLDFENIFILNMSEKLFPSMHFASSFLPYSIRNRFGLPIPEIEAERVVSYGWYRLLQRAQTSYCSYGDVCARPMQEKSRLLLQLEYDSPLKPIQRPVLFCVAAHIRSDWIVPKDAQVMQLLAKFLANKNEPTVSLTPSAFICYLSCPLQFYFSHLLRIKPVKYPKEQAASLQLGTFLHRVLELLYRPFVGKKLTPSTVKQIHVRVKKTIQEVVTDRATQDASIQTPQLLAALLEKLVEKQLERDAKDAPFTLIGVEMGSKTPLTLPLQLANGQTVQLGGIIDRVDEKEGTIRIIDYKTGTPNTKLSSLETLLDQRHIQKNKEILQLVFYAWLFQSTQKKAAAYRIMPCLMSIREYFVGTYVPGLWLQDGKNARTYSKIEDITPYLNDFQSKLIKELTHLFDPNLPFTQTDDVEICDRCPYVSICQRERVR